MTQFTTSYGHKLTIEGKKVTVVNKFGDRYVCIIDENGKLQSHGHLSLMVCMKAMNEYKNSQTLVKRSKVMKTTSNNNEMMTNAINHAEKMVSVCNKQIEYLTHPETYGCCLSKCNSIVINKERMMTVTTDETHRTTYEFSPLYPTYFSPETAREIVENDVYKDINGQPIKMEIVGKLEYYQMLKVWAEEHLRVMKSVIC